MKRPWATTHTLDSIAMQLQISSQVCKQGLGRFCQFATGTWDREELSEEDVLKGRNGL